MENKLTTAQVLELIRAKQSECNIKTLNTIDTIDTKNYKTKNYEISSVFANGGKQLPSSTSSPIGLVPEELEGVIPPTEETVGLNVSAAPEITYLSASLKATKAQTRTLNIDFRLSTTPAGKFNKLVFSLTNRYRDFFANLPEATHQDWEYQQAWEQYHSSSVTNKWLGKGRARGKYSKGKHINQKIKFGLSCVLEQKNGIYIANLWIEGLHKEIELSPVENAEFPYRYDSKTTLEKVEYIARGGWL
jgi:hypothetical protein